MHQHGMNCLVNTWLVPVKSMQHRVLCNNGRTSMFCLGNASAVIKLLDDIYLISVFKGKKMSMTKY